MSFPWKCSLDDHVIIFWKLTLSEPRLKGMKFSLYPYICKHAYMHIIYILTYKKAWRN